MSHKHVYAHADMGTRYIDKKKILKKYTRNSNDKTRSVMSDTVSNTTGSVNAS